MLDHCDAEIEKYARESEKKVGEFSIYCRYDLLKRSEEISKELEIAIFALSDIGSC